MLTLKEESLNARRLRCNKYKIKDLKERYFKERENHAKSVIRLLSSALSSATSFVDSITNL